MATGAELDDCRRVAEEAARLGGRELLRRFGDHGRVDYKTASTDLVSEADRASEARIVELLRARRPGDGILAEEGSDHVGDSGLRWVLDPLFTAPSTTSPGCRSGVVTWPASRADTGRLASVVGVMSTIRSRRDVLRRAGRGEFLNDAPLVQSPPGVALGEVVLAAGYAYDVAHRRVRRPWSPTWPATCTGCGCWARRRWPWPGSPRAAATRTSRTARSAGTGRPVLVIAVEAGAAVEVSGSGCSPPHRG